MKKTIIVVDMQNDFVNGVLGTKEARSIVGNVQERIRVAREQGEEIIFTRDTHTENYLKTQEGKNLPVPHCVIGSHGWDLAEGIEFAGAKVIDKPSFGSIELGSYAAKNGYDGIELIGVCTDICVISNAIILKAVLPEAQITVNSDCCAGATPEGHRNALYAMKNCQIDII